MGHISDSQNDSVPQEGVNSETLLSQVRDALQREATAIQVAAKRLDSTIVNAVKLLLQCEGRVIVTGMGKMGWIARKAASTFCSTGTPAIFLHPSEAAHGDLGVVTEQDVVIALSNSGETEEVLQLLPYMHRFDVPVITITGNLKSSLAKHSRIAIDASVTAEANPDSAAPTCSTTVTLALCDALAVASMKQRGFTQEDFAVIHPGGHIGRKLLLKVEDLMHTGDQIPIVAEDALLRDCIFAISQKGLGAALIIGDKNQLKGVMTDGDLRRTLQAKSNPLEDIVIEHMTFSPTTINAGALAAEALQVMKECEITILPVVDKDDRVTGIIHLHDLVRVGLA